MSKEQTNTQPQGFGVFQIPSLPGVRRDGTDTDAEYYNEAQWCRFVRNRPRKMGGYREVTPHFSGPAYGGMFWSRQFQNLFISFSKYGVEYAVLDQTGLAGTVQNISPAGYSANDNIIWSYDKLWDAAYSSGATLLIASPTRSLTNIDDPTLTNIYVTPLNAPGTMTPVADSAALCSGGLFCTSPYTVLLGNDGNVTWSDANQPQTYGSGDAGTARVTGTKLLKGLPLRTGISSGGLIWSMDSVIRMDYQGGSNIFKFSHITTQSSLLSQRSVIEVDGKWYWAGIDRFMVSNGVQVEELLNDMNLHWFFDNLNFAQRQKVFAMKMPRFGEIWWFFPQGDSTECNWAVIYNYRLKAWYDVQMSRGHGVTPQSYRFPLMQENVPNDSIALILSGVTGTYQADDIVRGVTSGAEGFVSSFSTPEIHIKKSNSLSFLATETLTNLTRSGSGTVSSTKNLYSLHTHENGYDAVRGGDIKAISSWFVTSDFGMPTGGVNPNAMNGQDINTRIIPVEPDFKMVGDMSVEVLGRTFAQSTTKPSREYTFDSETGKIDMREQAREFRLKFVSDQLGGFFEGGKTLVHTEPGDVRP